MPPHVPGRGVVGHYFDRCIILKINILTSLRDVRMFESRYNFVAVPAKVKQDIFQPWPIVLHRIISELLIECSYALAVHS